MSSNTNDRTAIINILNSVHNLLEEAQSIDEEIALLATKKKVNSDKQAFVICQIPSLGQLELCQKFEKLEEYHNHEQGGTVYFVATQVNQSSDGKVEIVQLNREAKGNHEHCDAATKVIPC